MSATKAIIEKRLENASLRVVAYIHKKALESNTLRFTVEVINEGNWPHSVFQDAETFASRDLSDADTWVYVEMQIDGVNPKKYCFDVVYNDRESYKNLTICKPFIASEQKPVLVDDDEVQYTEKI